MVTILFARPIASFGLGVWQIKRKARKEALIEALSARLSAHPINLPTDPAEVATLDYQHIRVVGTYDHKNELFLAPRTRRRENFDGNAGDPGAQIITPFVRADNGQRILVNRGWVPEEHRAVETRLEGQIDGTVEVDAIIFNPKPSKPNSFVPDNVPEKNLWFWVDLPAIAAALNAEPILVEVTDSSTPVSGFPLGGQTEISIRNEHMQYIVTWFTLSAVTAVMWGVRVRPQLSRWLASRR